MEPVRFALLGYGAWGSHHAQVIDACPDACLAAIVECDEERRAKAQAAHPGAKIFSDHRDMLATVDVEVVDIVLPNDLHYSVGMDAFRADKHLLMEKPLTGDLRQCRSLVETARDRKKLLAVGHQMRLPSLWVQAKELLDAGEIGQPLCISIDLWRNPYRKGVDDWRYDIHRVGNWILEEPIHFFDLARWYFGGCCSGEPVSVYARANAQDPNHPEHQDNFTALLQFAGGKYAVITQMLNAWEHHQTVKIKGTHGAIWASWSGALDRTLHPQFWLKILRGSQVEEIPIAKMSGEVYELQDEIAALASSVRNGTPFPCSAEDGWWSVAMCLKAQESVDTGKIVPLSLD